MSEEVDTNILLSYAVGRTNNENGYNMLAKLANQQQLDANAALLTNADVLIKFSEQCYRMENQFMQEYYSDHYALPNGTIIPCGEYDPHVHGLKTTPCRNKKGKWNKRAFLPNAYTSAKSVLSNCLVYGIRVADSDGKMHGKSYLQGKLKTTVRTATSSKPDKKSSILSIIKMARDALGDGSGYTDEEVLEALQMLASTTYRGYELTIRRPF